MKHRGWLLRPCAFGALRRKRTSGILSVLTELANWRLLCEATANYDQTLAKCRSRGPNTALGSVTLRGGRSRAVLAVAHYLKLLPAGLVRIAQIM